MKSLSILLALVLAPGLDDPLPRLSKKELEQGTRVKLKAEGRRLEQIARDIEEQTGNPVQEPIGPGPGGVWWADQPVSVSVSRASFWEAVDAVAEAAGLHAVGNLHRKAAFDEEPEVFHHGDFAAPAANRGAFRVQPTSDGRGHSLDLCLFAEPRIFPPDVTAATVRVEPAGAAPIAIEADVRYDGDGAIVSVPLKRVPEEVTAAALEVELTLAVVTAWKTEKLGRLEDLAGEPWEEDGLSVTVTELVRPGDEAPGQEPLHLVKLTLEGARVPPDRVVLLDRRGKRLVPSQWSSGGRNRDSLEIGYEPHALDRDLGEYVLAADVPDRRLEWPLALSFEQVRLR